MKKWFLILPVIHNYLLMLKTDYINTSGSSGVKWIEVYINITKTLNLENYVIEIPFVEELEKKATFFVVAKLCEKSA